MSLRNVVNMVETNKRNRRCQLALNAHRMRLVATFLHFAIFSINYFQAIGLGKKNIYFFSIIRDIESYFLKLNELNINNPIHLYRYWIKVFCPKHWFPRRGNINVQLYITHSYSAMFIQTYYFLTKTHWMKTFCFCTFLYEFRSLHIQKCTFIHERKTSSYTSMPRCEI